MDLKPPVPRFMPKQLTKRRRVLDVILDGITVAFHLVDEPHDKRFEVYPIHELSVGPAVPLRGRIERIRNVHTVGAGPRSAAASGLSGLSSTTSRPPIGMMSRSTGEGRRWHARLAGTFWVWLGIRLRVWWSR
jgi:hypothetical protein